MIYLFTGSNGSGKTLYSIKFIEEVLRKDKNNFRNVYYFDSPNQSLSIEECGRLDWEKITIDQLHEWYDTDQFPPGSIFLVDEFRNAWPYRPTREKIPLSVDRLSEHRSKGYDFVLTAQKPTGQFDPPLSRDQHRER